MNLISHNLSRISCIPDMSVIIKSNNDQVSVRDIHQVLTSEFLCSLDCVVHSA